MYYTIYKTTNTVTGKYYIGKHQTTDINDGYLGSGKLLKRAIKKYGIENFTKEILHVFGTEEEMNSKEKELVVVSEETYNLCEGGQGGFSYINRNGFNVNQKNFGMGFKGKKHTQETIELFKKLNSGCKNPMFGKKRNNSGYNNPMFGLKHNETTKEKMKIAHKGVRNSQFGSFWITNGIENKKSKGKIPEGFRKGRVI